MHDDAAPASPAGLLLLLGGPAGAGKSTLAAAWCRTRPRAVHIELDRVRELIVSGRADPQQPNALQAAQYTLSVAACCALARPFLAAGYDIAVDDVFEPEAYARDWRPHLAGLPHRLVILLPSLAATLARAAARPKRVLPAHTISQHATCATWPNAYRLDTTDLTPEGSLTRLLDWPAASPDAPLSAPIT